MHPRPPALRQLLLQLGSTTEMTAAANFVVPGGQVERSEVCRLIVRPDEDGKLKAAKEKRAAETPKEAEKETEKNEEATMEGDEGEGEEAAGSVVEHEVDEEEQAQVGAFSGDEGDDDEEEEPVIDDEPRGVAVRQGESAKFRVEAHGLKPLAYQWYVDNRVLDGETKPELLVRRAEPRHAGRYTCKVSNPRGEVTTIPARLEVETAAAGGAQEAEDLGDEVEEFSAD